MVGGERPDAAGPVRRFIAVAEAWRTLLAGGLAGLDAADQVLARLREASRAG